jgi:hypothetical protein
MSAEDELALAIAEWQRKHRIEDGDPMIAVLELVRIHLQHAHEIDDDPEAPPPPFEEFRSVIELLDRRSKSFVQQAADVMGEMRRFGQSIERVNETRLALHLTLTAFGVVFGLLLGKFL